MTIKTIENSVFEVEGFCIEIEGSVVSTEKYYRSPADENMQLTKFINERLIKRYPGIKKVTAFDGLGRVANGHRILRALRNSYTLEEISCEYKKEVSLLLSLLLEEENENKILKKKIRYLKRIIKKFESNEDVIEENMDIDPYDVFQMSVESSAEELLSQYRRKAALLHPDRVDHMDPSIKDFASERTTELNVARKKLVEMGAML